jgi:hypothetical protein
MIINYTFETNKKFFLILFSFYNLHKIDVKSVTDVYYKLYCSKNQLRR